MKILSFLVLLLFIQLSVYGNEEILIKKSDISWMKPVGDSYVAKLNQTMELGLNLDKEIAQQIENYITGARAKQLNPYNPEEVDVIAIFNSPSGKAKKGIGFYYQEFKEDLATDAFLLKKTDEPWRVRFAPNEVGTWTVQIEVKAKGFDNPFMYSVKFKCETSEHKGRLVTHETGTEEDRYLYYEASKERFIAVGMNISSGGFFTYKPSQNKRQMGGVEKLAAVNGNFVRFEIGAQGSLPDWNDVHNYTSKQDEMFGFDRLLATAEKNQIYAILFRHHVEIMGAAWDLPNWQNNPYRKQFQFEKISDYFTNPEAIKLQHMNLRYMYARWGYSPYWSFYGYSELEKFIDPMIEQEGISDEAAIQIFKKWLEGQIDYIRTNLDNQAMFANSYGTMKKTERKKGYDGILKASDVTAVHVYSSIKDGNFVNRANYVDDFWKSYKQPVILEEIGLNDDKLALYCCTGIDFHNQSWATTFTGSIGTGLDWWWDRGVMDFGYESSLAPLQKFIQPLSNKSLKFSPYRWADAGGKSRLLETYALISDDQQEIYGWLHNASYYWRNDVNNPCVQSLLDSSNVIEKCIVGDNTEIGRNEPPGDYAQRHSDKYSSRGGFQQISGGMENNPSFILQDALKGGGKNRIWYKVEFFSTRSGENLKSIEGFDQVVRAGFGKKLKIVVPNLNDSNPDVAYKITMIGFGKKETEIRKPNKEMGVRWL
jgi:hypothetical protein